MGEFVPNKNATESSKLDQRSIRFIKNLLPDDDVDCSQLHEGGTLPNIDGYLDFLCKDGTANERIFVQVKHLTYAPINGDAFYDIPKSIYAYSERHKGEVIVFIACYPESKVFYWRYIDDKAIKEFKSLSETIQETARYHFKPEESCTKENVNTIVATWKRLYKERMEAIKDEKQLAEAFASTQRVAFNRIPFELHGLSNSHIRRPETGLLYNWVIKGLPSGKKNLCLLVGDAGMGKSVVIKDLIGHLENDGVRCLCLKADTLDDASNPVSLETIYDTIAYYASNQQPTVFIIDQIDALSQSLSTDRNRLNALISVLSSIEDWPNVRAVVSCRKYDLEYDAVLNGLKDKSETVELGLLSENEVKDALEKLEQGLVDRISSTTFSILRNVQYLNSFCYLFQRNKRRLNFNSPIELYDALWDSVLDGLPAQIVYDDAEKVLYDIAECIKKSGTLKPVWQPISNLRAAYTYLASNGIVLPDGNAVSFFHQTFFDYALAKSYLSQNKSYISDLENEFQGLEIRSTVKAVLEYVRGHNDVGYASEIQQLLTSEKIRLHIKLLAISIFATANDPRPVEKRIVKTVCQKDERLLSYFLRGVQGETWFSTASFTLKAYLPDSDKHSILLIPMLSVLSRYSFSHPDEVFSLIDSIKDEETKLYARSYVLRGHNDYCNNKVIDAFRSVCSPGSVFAVNWIQDAMQSNEVFGLEETGKLLQQFLESDNYSHNHDGYELVDVLSKNLSNTHPGQFLPILHSCLVQFIRNNAVKGYYGFTISKRFNGFSSDEYFDKLLDIYEQLLLRFSSDLAVIAPLVDELLSLNNETSLGIAFSAMAEHPELHSHIIESLVANSSTIEKYLQGSVEYYFLRMLKSWYLTLDSMKAEEYQRRVLSYVSSSDFLANKEKKYSKMPFPHLWHEKWELICNTLPNNGLLPDMKKCAGELQRRFGRRFIVERDRHGITSAVYCGGLTDDAAYATFSPAIWLSSFMKLNETKSWHFNRKPIDLRAHADAFKKCVAAAPVKFKDFVFEISQMKDINSDYLISGIEGLLDGGVDIDEMWPLASRFICTEYASANSFSFGQIAGHYFKTDNKYIDMILPVVVNVMTSPPDERLTDYSNDKSESKLEDIVNNMLTRAINSEQGRALELLIQLALIPKRRKQAYDIITNAIPSLNQCLRTLPVHYLYVKDHFDESMYFPLLKECLSYLGPEALVLRGDAVQWCFYHKPDVVCDYIERIEKDTKSHVILSQICFYGLCVDGEKDKCKEMLDRILYLNDEHVIATIVKVSMKMFADPDYTHYSRAFLERFVSDGREEVVDSYCLYCDELPIDAFNFYRELAKFWKSQKHRDIHSQLEYVTKCIASYPVECYKFVEDQDYASIEDQWIADEEVVKVLLKIYGKMKEDDDEASLNEIMDLFDEFIFRGNRVIYSAVEELS